MMNDLIWEFFDNSDDPILIFDKRQHIVYANSSVSALTGQSPLYLSALNFNQLLHPDYTSQFHQLISSFSAGSSFSLPASIYSLAGYKAVGLQVQRLSGPSTHWMVIIKPAEREAPPAPLSLPEKEQLDKQLNVLLATLNHLTKSPRSDQLDFNEEMQQSISEVSGQLQRVRAGLKTVETSHLPKAEVSIAIEKKLLQGRRLLYVDDVMLNHLLLEGLCNGWGITLDSALNGQEALDKMYETAYDLVLMDLHMPLMDGLETSRRIRQSRRVKNPKLSIIAISVDNTLSLDKLQEHGVDALLQKPLQPEELYKQLLIYLS
ncbi:MAG: response regulator [Cyclobacteriaceae bacterium]